ncbi:hypothetical protein QTH87_04305 [Variovorax sp. J22P168]|uniref:hypothetical protein n=1 Tax=Variovorax jilinensis TaxID=3053513 RepID=UPI002578A224|nr:hypothetical protein [Variovorax sp. J22P168]MDM0011657.1 hypothetical protein [Variovorax sp. J22P168]
MPMELLRRIAGRRLPYTLYAAADIDRLRALRTAGLVTAWVPPPAEQMQAGGDPDSPAQVLAITPKGRKVLAGELGDPGL